MLLIGPLTVLLALIDLVIGVGCLIIYLVDVNSWTTVLLVMPLFKENSGLVTFMQIMCMAILLIGWLQVLASSSNNRVLWTVCLTGKCLILAGTISLGVQIGQHDVRSEEFLRAQLVALFAQYNHSKPIAKLLDGVHQTHSCCGYRSDHSEWAALIGPGRVPDSCCLAPVRRGCGYNNQSAWLSRLHNAACHIVMWGAYESWDPVALFLFGLFVYLMWLGVLFNFYKVFLASYLASEVKKYLSMMDTLKE